MSRPFRLIETDEWVSSPVFKESHMPLRSGHVMQIETCHPDAYARIMARTCFMRDVIGFDVPETMLPLSDMAGIAPPFLLSPNKLIRLG
ncbi:hypothetical protein [uncultured Hoeflea sp.]|uniref:hypothetical protein n=1 Tax=uncultured Hoeflea sp. TaxID=538666 RepID=UPI0026394902|nr:hypothetical protein [uncultured Hoeflea sp.]